MDRAHGSESKNKDRSRSPTHRSRDHEDRSRHRSSREHHSSRHSHHRDHEGDRESRHRSSRDRHDRDSERSTRDRHHHHYHHQSSRDHKERHHRSSRHTSSQSGRSDEKRHDSSRSSRIEEQKQLNFMENPDMAVEKEKDAATPALETASVVPTAVLSDSDGEWVIKADTGATSSEEDSSDDELETHERKNVNYNDKAEGSRDPGVLATAPSGPAVNLNQLKSQILRLKLQGKAEEATALQAQYDNAVESGGSSNIKVLDSVDIRQTQLLQSTHKAEPGDMTVADMVREEKLTAGNNRADREWANVLVASRASASGNAEDDNDELFDAASAGRGPRRTHASQKTDKDKALERTRTYNALADRCPLCVDSTAVAPGNKPLPISFATRAYLTPAPAPALVPHTMAIVPIEHEARNLTALDADDWEEIRNYMKCLIRYWSEVSRGRTSVVFYENAVFSQGESGARSHPALFAVPVPTDLLESSVIPGAFRAAFESADEEWSTHRKVIDSSRVPGGFRATFAKEAPYFHVWFNINGGLGHIVEGDRWPRHDLFAREVLGGVLGTDNAVIKRRTRWTDTSDAEFEKSFLKYDWVDQVQQY